jgi:hypothetical protein
VPELSLAETIASLRAELAEAVRTGADSGIHFTVGQVQLEIHVGVTQKLGGKAGARFWVVQLDGEGSYAKEQIQKITVTLEAPVDQAGRPVKVTRDLPEKP